MKNSTESKPYTESATATKKNSRWFRISSQRGEIEQLFDLYWGGKERRITGMTLRIMGVNALAVITLVIGGVYLGKYKDNLVENKLERFKVETILVTAAVSEGALATQKTEDGEVIFLSQTKSEKLVGHLAATLGKRIMVFDVEDKLVADSQEVIKNSKVGPIVQIVEEKEPELSSVELLKDILRYTASLFPRFDRLPKFRGIESLSGADYLDVVDAKKKMLSFSVWRSNEDDIILTAAMPILTETTVAGVVFIINENNDIQEALDDTFFDVVKIFCITLAITMLLSIYLSGVIAKPLRKLAQAAEDVRKGKLKHTDIPDMSDRHDEIGELSVVLRDMTNALWERMDTIEAFAADVSHEIKNPLSSLKSAVETAGIVKKKEDLNKLLDVIKNDVDRLDRLITDISNASRLDAELSREVFEVVDMKKVLRELIDSYKSPLERDVDSKLNNDEALKDGVLITLDLSDEDDIFVRGSEGRLIQVLQNIISNALSFAPKKSRIRIATKIKSKRLTIFIDDEGQGIPKGKLKTIFERFYSERPKHEDYGRHSGLGLSICKQIITAHNGILYAENLTDRSGEITGARFIIVLNIL